MGKQAFIVLEIAVMRFSKALSFFAILAATLPSVTSAQTESNEPKKFTIASEESSATTQSNKVIPIDGSSWDPKFVEEYATPFSKKVIIPDPFLSTAANSAGYAALLFRRNPYRGFNSRPLGIREDVPFRVFEANLKEGETADLTVVIPGLTEGLQDLNARMIGEKFADRNHHVLVLPNTWTPEFIKGGPGAPPGDLEAEAKWTLSLIHRVAASIGEEKIAKVNLWGTSYGSELSLVVYGLDSESRNPIVSGDVNIISPPVGLKQGMNNLDSYIDDTLDNREELGTMKDEVLSRILSFKPSRDGHDKKLNQWAKPMVALDGFQAKAQSTSISWLKRKGIDPRELIPDIDTFRFEDMKRVLEHVNGEEFLPGEKDSSFYWIQKAAANGKRNIRIVTTIDEILNSGVDVISEFEKAGFTVGKNLIILDWGGHVGFNRFYQEFLRPLLDIHYGLPVRNNLKGMPHEDLLPRIVLGRTFASRSRIKAVIRACSQRFGIQSPMSAENLP